MKYPDDPIVLCLCIADEADIVKDFLDCHLSLGIEYFIATDVGSVDSTMLPTAATGTEEAAHYRNFDLVVRHPPEFLCALTRLNTYASRHWVRLATLYHHGLIEAEYARRLLGENEIVARLAERVIERNGRIAIAARLALIGDGSGIKRLSASPLV